MDRDEQEDHAIARTLGAKSQAIDRKLTNSISEPKATTANYLTFPRPALDGSLPDLIVTTPREPTPPAALSSLGARAYQQQGAMTRNMGDSVSSFADSTYDMVDDASEISSEVRTAEEDFNTDDADTVSLTSTGRRSSDADGFTPEGSVVDLDEHVLRVPSSTTAAGPYMSQNSPALQTRSDAIDIGDFRRQISQAFEMEDEPADSILSDDLETPRQSTMAPQAQAGTVDSPFSTYDARRPQSTPIRVLFLAAEDTLPEEQDRVFKTMASSLAGRPDYECKTWKMPPTPSDRCPESTTIYLCGAVGLSVQRCTDVQARPAPYGTGEKRSYLFRLVDVDDKTPSAMFGLCNDLKSGGLRLPQLAVFYTSAPKYEEPAFFEVAHNMFKYDHEVPRLVLGKGLQGKTSTSDKDECNMSLQSFYNCDPSGLKQGVEKLFRVVHSYQTEGNEEADLTVKTKRTSTQGDNTSWLSQVCDWFLRDMNRLFILVILLAIGFGHMSLSNNLAKRARASSAEDLAFRRMSFEICLAAGTNSSLESVRNSVNVSHLVPDPNDLPTDALSFHSQRVARNALIVSVAKGTRQPRYPTLLQVNASRGESEVPCKFDTMLDGIYDVVLELEDAYGLLNISLLTTDPDILVHLTQDFGTSLLQRAKLAQRSSYEHATSKFLREVGPGFRATRNVTTQLAVQMAKDLQLFANTAMGFASKAAQAGNATAYQVSKELALVQNDLVEFSHNVHESLGAATSSLKSLIPSKTSIKTCLASSRERAIEFKKALQNSKKARMDNKTALKKSLATHFPLEQLFRPFKRETGLVRRVTDVAQCVRLNGFGEFKKCRDDSSLFDKPTHDAGLAKAKRSGKQSETKKDAKKQKRGESLSKQEKKTCKKHGKGPAPKKKAEQEKRNTHRGGKKEMR